MEPAQKSDFFQLRLEQTQKHLSPTDMLRLFPLIIRCLESICFRNVQNALYYLWVANHWRTHGRVQGGPGPK